MSLSSKKPLRKWPRSSKAYWTKIREEKFSVQHGKCAICDVPITLSPARGDKTAAHLDHDHITGQIRGVLCFTCNVGLGSFGDSVKQMELAIRYLENHKNKPIYSL